MNIEEGNIIPTQPDEEGKIGTEALAMMQQAMGAFDSLEGAAEAAPKQVESEDKKSADIKPTEIRSAGEVEESNEEPEVQEEVIDTTVDSAKEKTLSKEAKYRKLQKDKYKALAEKEGLLREVDELKKLLNDSLNSGTYHYSKSAHAELEKAKQDKKSAIENGDIEALIEADIALTEAITNVNELKKWAAQDKRNVEVTPVPPKPVQNNYDRSNDHNYDRSYNSINQEIAQDWLDTHSYLQPGSRDYNAPLAKEVSGFVTQLDNDLRRSNQMDLYFTDDYFDTIDGFISDNMKKTYARTERAPVAANHIGGVRHGHSPSVNGGVQKSKKVTLSEDEKIFCRNAGLPEEVLIARKLEN